MKISLPYQLLLLFFLSVLIVLAISPSLAVQKLADAVKSNNKTDWPTLVNQPYLKKYNAVLVEGLLRNKMKREIRNRTVTRATAMQDFSFAMSGIDRLASKLSEPKGFRHTLCGEVARFPDLPEKNDSECWAMEGEWHWQSPTIISVDYINPATGWTTQLKLQRQGLFNWQAVSIVLPIEEMLKQLEKNL